MTTAESIDDPTTLNPPPPPPPICPPPPAIAISGASTTTLKDAPIAAGRSTATLASQVSAIATHQQSRGPIALHSSASVHAVNPAERAAFARHINAAVGDRESLSDRLPLDPHSEDAIFAAVRDGLLLWYARLIALILYRIVLTFTISTRIAT